MLPIKLLQKFFQKPQNIFSQIQVKLEMFWNILSFTCCHRPFSPCLLGVQLMWPRSNAPCVHIMKFSFKVKQLKVVAVNPSWWRMEQTTAKQRHFLWDALETHQTFYKCFLSPSLPLSIFKFPPPVLKVHVNLKCFHFMAQMLKKWGTVKGKSNMRGSRVTPASPREALRRSRAARLAVFLGL